MKKSLLLISASILMITIGCQSDDDEFYMEAQYKNNVERNNIDSNYYLQENTDKGGNSPSDTITPIKDLIHWKSAGDSIPPIKDLIHWKR